MASIIALIFLQDYHPFLLEAIKVSGLGLFPFQAHPRLTWNLFLLTCKLASLHSNSFKRVVHIDFKITFQRFCMNILLPMSFSTYYLIFITPNWNHVQTQVQVHGYPLTHSSYHFVWPQNISFPQHYAPGWVSPILWFMA